METRPSKIIYTKIDEAPALATYSLLPILRAFTKGSGIEIESWDISLAGRILACFPDSVSEAKGTPDYLSMLGELVEKPDANIVKLPNISASIPQLKEAIKELQTKGYDLPDYPENPKTETEKKLQAKYAKVLGSAVNPVLREGNSDRRPAAAVKRFARKNPHKMMKEWPEKSKAYVAHMTENDFYGNERSTTVEKACSATITFTDENGTETLLRKIPNLQPGEVIDASVLNVGALRRFFEEQIRAAEEKGLLLSLHLKATMMKVSDPIMFGHCVSIFFRDVFEKHASAMKKLAVNPNYGLGDLMAKIRLLPEEQREEIESDIRAVFRKRPQLAMVDSEKGITNLHAPNDTIIDASMPVVVRNGGKLWDSDNRLRETVAMIPDRCYATVYREVFRDCQRYGAFDPARMGSVSNVGLMAQKAEEYGSHDKTFEAPAQGKIGVIDSFGTKLLERNAETGDIFRMCRTKDLPIQDWVKLAVKRARHTRSPAVFWLDEKRAHDAQLIGKVNRYLRDCDRSGLDIRLLPPVEAMRFTLKRVREGKDTIAVTGNVLRDYLTDLFPILELGTSAKMLSIVPLLNGGGLFETGAGGSAPKHVRQFLREGHLRWDSLGEYCAFAASLEHLSNTQNNGRARIYAETLDRAIERHLENGKSPSRRVGELDSRGSHYYLALYWAAALAEQEKDAELRARFSAAARKLAENEAKIIEELERARGRPVELDGYYRPDPVLLDRAMRPSSTLNAIVDAI